jgi:hypothetical protein
MKLTRRIFYVIIAAILAGMPGAALMQPWGEAPLWYLVLAAVVGSVGVGLMGIVFGAIVLIAARHRPDRGVRAAVITAGVVGIFASWTIWYGLQATSR